MSFAVYQESAHRVGKQYRCLCNEKARKKPAWWWWQWIILAQIWSNTSWCSSWGLISNNWSNISYLLSHLLLRTVYKTWIHGVSVSVISMFLESAQYLIINPVLGAYLDSIIRLSGSILRYPRQSSDPIHTWLIYYQSRMIEC